MPDTAAYYADKLVTFSGYDREALLLLAKVKNKLLRTNITHGFPGSVRDKDIARVSCKYPLTAAT